MLFETSRQIPLFLVFFCCGAVQGTLYALLYLLRRRNKPFLTVAADAAFALFFLVSSLFVLIRFDGGVFRPYQALALLCGAATAHWSIGYGIKKIIDFFAQVLYNVYSHFKKTDREGAC